MISSEFEEAELTNKAVIAMITWVVSIITFKSLSTSERRVHVYRSKFTLNLRAMSTTNV